MAKKVFAVYLAKEDVPNSEAYATLELPASPWELWDAMEKVRLKDGEALYMLHHMSRIFEDNSKIDQIHRGLQIDRKRRQELQRKRLAMGHKPDDHEEQTFR